MAGGLIRIRELKIDIPKEAKALAEKMLKDLENSKRPYLEAVKTSLDNSFYNSKVGYLTPGDKVVRTELNVSSVQKLARVVFMLEIMLRNLDIGAVNTKRELYYICKGLIKGDSRYRPLDFEDQGESDAIIDFIGDMLKVYREELNCFANDRGGQTYSNQLIVEEKLPDGTKARIDLSTLGTSPFMPKNRPQSLTLKIRKKIDFAIVVESEGTANTLHTMGFTKRNNCILMGAGGVPSNGVRGWCKLIQEELEVPIYFFGDLDAYTLQNIFRTLKAGSSSEGGDGASPASPDPGADGGFRADAAGLGFVTIEQSTGPSTQTSASATFLTLGALAQSPQWAAYLSGDLSKLGCTQQTVGACRVTVCDSSLVADADAGADAGGGAETGLVGAGTITFAQGGQALADLTLQRGDAGSYAATSSTTDPSFAGQTIAVTASGDRVAAFQQSVSWPSTITLTAPAVIDGGADVAAGADLPLAWTGGVPASGQVTVQLYGDLASSTSTITKGASCSFDPAVGAAVIPAAVLQAVVPASKQILVAISSMTVAVVPAGDFDVELLGVVGTPAFTITLP